MACVCGGIAAIAKAFAEEPAQFRTVHGFVTKISDGDTIHFQPVRRASASEESGVEATGPELRVRMLGMDAPETHLPTNNGMVGQGKWGQLATDQLEKLVPEGSRAVLMTEGTDVHGRTLGRLVYQHRDINLAMVRSGWAVPYVICDGPRCTPDFFERENVATYLRACDEARAQGRGIFNPRHPLREMPFEFRLRMQNRRPDKYVGDFDTKKLYEPADYPRVDLCRRIFFFKEEEARRVGFR